MLLEDGPRAADIGASARASVVQEASVGEYAERLLAVCRLAVEEP